MGDIGLLQIRNNVEVPSWFGEFARQEVERIAALPRFIDYPTQRVLDAFGLELMQAFRDNFSCSFSRDLEPATGALQVSTGCDWSDIHRYVTSAAFEGELIRRLDSVSVTV